MSKNIGIVEILALFGRIPGALRRRSEDRRHRKMLMNAPSFAVRDMPENTFGKLVGTVRPHKGRVLEAPLSKRLCVYYDISIDSMHETSMLYTLATEQNGMTFELEDETGTALIDPAHAIVSAGIDALSESTLYGATGRERDLIVQLGLSGKKVPFAHSLRFREAILEVDERVAVHGGGIRDVTAASAESTYRETSTGRICLTGTAKFPLFISDDPHATTGSRVTRDRRARR